MAPALHPLPWRDPLDVFCALRDSPFAMLMNRSGPSGRWTGLFAHPRESQLAKGASEALAISREWLAELAPARATCGAPFRTGVSGILGYDAGEDGGPVLTGVGLYDLVLVFDHQERRAHLLESPGADPLRRSALCGLLGGPPPPPPAAGGGRVTDVEPREAFGRKVEAVRARIACGEFYQANISRRFAGRLGDGDHPFDLFRRLASASPAPFSAYVRLPGCAIVSNSPERLVQVRAVGDTRIALTSPIKGTSPRGATPGEDERNARALLASEKDRAENLMIVDLMRNDLAVACRPGSVRTPALFELSTLPNVHHLVSHVRGVIRPERSA
ncbi:MAG: chorismate-binding protein, partial [Phenylobacterium sp.]